MRLTHKYAEVIDGIDLSEREVGDRLPLPSRDARMLIAEGWAEPVASQEQRDRDIVGVRRTVSSSKPDHHT